MSRTYKDIPWKIRHPQEDNYERVEYELESPRTTWNGKIVTTSYFGVYKAGVKTKKKKNKDTEWHWMSTPGWWVSMFMTRPQRHAGKMWERKVLKANIEDVDLLDTPNVSRKPHCYYW